MSSKLIIQKLKGLKASNALSIDEKRSLTDRFINASSKDEMISVIREYENILYDRCLEYSTFLAI